MLALALLVLLAFAAPAATPDAFPLLERTRDAYRALDAYADSGEIAVETAGAGEVRYRFETRFGGGGASYLLERLGGESPDTIERPALWAVFRNDAGAFLYDGRSDSYRSIASVEAGLVELLGSDRRAAALVALALVAPPERDLLESPLAASVAGAADCGGRRCWSLDVTPASSPGTLRLEIDRETHLVRSVALAIEPIDALTASGDVAAGLRDAKEHGRADETRHLVVRYAPIEGGGASAAPWRPPTTARIEPAAATDTSRNGVAAPSTADSTSPAVAPGAGPSATSTESAQRPDHQPGRVFGEQIEVRLKTIAVRAIDLAGKAIPDLGPTDFRVRVGGEEAAIRSVDWIAPGSDRFTPDELSELARSGVTVPASGRLIVIFVQTDIHPSRAPGQLRLLPELKKLLATFSPEDEVAVVSFDSHLKLRQDFTRDHDVIPDAVWTGIRTGREEAIPPRSSRPPRYPSLASSFDFEAARRASSPEQGLRVVGEALLPLPGEKIMIYAGWGLGNYFAGTVTMGGDYYDARRALAAAHVSVFVLDVTQADYHSLEIGLETIAEDTGGTYEKTFQEPLQMTARLAHTLEGYYEIAFEMPETIERRGKVSIELVNRRGEVLMRPSRLNG